MYLILILLLPRIAFIGYGTSCTVQHIMSNSDCDSSNHKVKKCSMLLNKLTQLTK